jgi:hypothetical protein
MKNKKQLRETMHSNSRAVEENEQGGNNCKCIRHPLSHRIIKGCDFCYENKYW